MLRRIAQNARNWLSGIYDCRHPLWGGAGICLEGEGSTEDQCDCDVGFADQDAMGQPSCVPKLALVIGYTSMAVVGTASSLFL